MAVDVNGIAHIPAAPTLAKDTSYGGGCAGNNGFTLTDVSSGLPTSPNPAFQLGAYSGTGADLAAVLISGTEQNPAIDLAVIGMTGGCFLRIGNPVVTLAGPLTGAGFGAGSLRIPIPIPANLNGVLYRQWAEVQVTKTNLLGVVVSNARKMEIK